MATIYLICDLSGSMLESGKRFIMRNLIRTVDQYYRLRKDKPEIKLVAWSDSVIIGKWEYGQEVPNAMIACGGSLSGQALIDKLAPIGDGFFMMFTDGYWALGDRKLIGEWSRGLPSGRLRIIKVGEDADSRLNGPSVFHAEDLLVALKGWVV